MYLLHGVGSGSEPLVKEGLEFLETLYCDVRSRITVAADVGGNEFIKRIEIPRIHRINHTKDCSFATMLYSIGAAGFELAT